MNARNNLKNMVFLEASNAHIEAIEEKFYNEINSRLKLGATMPQIYSYLVEKQMIFWSPL